MKLQAFLPLITYPDAISDSVAGNATALAAFLGADLHVSAFNVDIPNVSNALSRMLMKLPDLIRQTEAQGRARGEHLLAIAKAEAAERAVHVTTSTSTAGPPAISTWRSSVGRPATRRRGRRQRPSRSAAAGRPSCCRPRPRQVRWSTSP